MGLLFTKGRIGSLQLKNRIVRSATAERMADNVTGRPLPQLVKLWVDLAHGGTGLIITGHMYVHPSGKCHPEMTGIHTDSLVPDLEKAVQAVHAAGGKIAAQINHGGMQCSREAVDGTIAPSAISDDILPQPAREMTEAEIESLINAYAQSARRALEAGFDAVQLHGAHGYLISQFNSPYVNQRQDQWGGSLENRSRFLKEIASAVRAQVGPDYPVFIKFGMQDGVEGGLTAEEGAQLVALMGEMNLDAIEISGGVRSNASRKGIRSADREAYYAPLARLARQHTILPLILVGGMRTKSVMESTLEAQTADFIAMCRPLINEPNLPNLMVAGEVVKSSCISSNNCWPKNDGEGIACKCPIPV